MGTRKVRAPQQTHQRAPLGLGVDSMPIMVQRLDLIKALRMVLHLLLRLAPSLRMDSKPLHPEAVQKLVLRA